MLNKDELTEARIDCAKEMADMITIDLFANQYKGEIVGDFEVDPVLDSTDRQLIIDTVFDETGYRIKIDRVSKVYNWIVD